MKDVGASNKNQKNKHKNELGFDIPKEYFKTSKTTILNSIKEENKKTAFTLKQVFPYAIAASLLVFIGLTFLKKKKTITMPTKNVNIYKSNFYNTNYSPVTTLFMDDTIIDDYADELLEGFLIAEMEAKDEIIENEFLDMLFENDSLIDEQINAMLLDNII